MRRLVGSVAVVVAGLVIACDGDGLDTVRVCGDLAVPDDLVALRVTVSSIVDGALVERTAGLSVLVSDDDLSGADGDVVAGAGGADTTRQLPIEVAVRSVSGTRNVRVQALDARGAEVMRGDTLVEGRPDGAIIVNLARACLGFECALGQTCEDGACTVTPAAGSRACTSAGTP